MKKQAPMGAGYVLDVSREYSLYVNATRGIPKVTDGLKDAMRKAMWVMRSRGKIKTSALSGAMQEQQLYHHGDASDSICSLAAPFGNNVPLLSALGNFGTRINPSTYGAPRYTEVARPSYVEDLFYSDLDILDLIENFDGSNYHPSTFLPVLPFLLVNGMSGIGVGYSTTTLPRDPVEVADAVIAVLDGKKKIPLLKPKYTWCDCDVEFVEYSPGGGAKWWFGGKVQIKDTSTLLVTDLPPEHSLEKFKEYLNELEDKSEIAGYEDESSDKIRVTVKLKRGAAKGWTERDAVDFLRVRYTRTENIVVNSWDSDRIINYVYDPETKTDPVEGLLRDWVQWRFGWYVKRYQHLTSRDDTELRLRRLIKQCFVDKLPAQLPSLQNKAAVTDRVKQIGAKLSPDDKQVDHVVSLPTYRWTRESEKDTDDRIAELEKQLRDWGEMLSSEEKRSAAFKTDVLEAKKSLKSAAFIIKDVRESDNG